MFVFEKNAFTDRSDLQDIYDQIVSEVIEDDEDEDTPEDIILSLLGYKRTANYYHESDFDNTGIEVNTRTSSDLQLNSDYEFFVEWYYSGSCTPVLIKNIIDLQDFLRRYLPVVQNIGALNLIWRPEP